MNISQGVRTVIYHAKDPRSVVMINGTGVSYTVSSRAKGGKRLFSFNQVGAPPLFDISIKRISDLLTNILNRPGVMVEIYAVGGNNIKFSSDSLTKGDDDGPVDSD